MNHISITGRLTAEPELKQTKSGITVCTFALAVKRPKVKDTTDFLNCVAWRQSAEYLTKYGHKGDMVAATGSLTARKWQDKDGNNRISFETVCDTVELLTSRASNEGEQIPTQTAFVAPAQSYTPTAYAEQAQPRFEEVSSDEDLPF